MLFFYFQDKELDRDYFMQNEEFKTPVKPHIL